jgi:hypothetical protein
MHASKAPIYTSHKHSVGKSLHFPLVRDVKFGRWEDYVEGVDNVPETLKESGTAEPEIVLLANITGS